jgi:hypothetical protein
MELNSVQSAVFDFFHDFIKRCIDEYAGRFHMVRQYRDDIARPVIAEMAGTFRKENTADGIGTEFGADLCVCDVRYSTDFYLRPCMGW